MVKLLTHMNLSWGAGDDFESTVYSCDTRLSKESLIEFDRLNSQNKIEWF